MKFDRKAGLTQKISPIIKCIREENCIPPHFLYIFWYTTFSALCVVMGRIPNLRAIFGKSIPDSDTDSKLPLGR